MPWLVSPPILLRRQKEKKYKSPHLFFFVGGYNFFPYCHAEHTTEELFQFLKDLSDIFLLLRCVRCCVFISVDFSIKSLFYVLSRIYKGFVKLLWFDLFVMTSCRYSVAYESHNQTNKMLSYHTQKQTHRQKIGWVAISYNSTWFTGINRL